MEMVSINFDSNDRIRRIGSIQMSYNRFALERVGEFITEEVKLLTFMGL
jgi:hypothetical protein